nr:pilus assembly protein TadG-related protein [Streptomyces sp. CC224B]
MRSVRSHADAGQTLPLYIWLTAILLFAALAFFAFAQAASARNGAQSAADAAALAGAQAIRDELAEGLGTAIGTGEGDEWLDWLDGDMFTAEGAREAAEALAAENDSAVDDAGSTEVDGYPGYAVGVTTNYTVGDSIIPGTESQHAKAEATAVIKPRCDAEAPIDPGDVVEFTCDGQEDPIEIDPEDFDPDDLPDPSVLFSVHLAK